MPKININPVARFWFVVEFSDAMCSQVKKIWRWHDWSGIPIRERPEHSRLVTGAKDEMDAYLQATNHKEQ